MFRNTPLRCAFLFLCALAFFPLTTAGDLVRPTPPKPASETNPSLGTRHVADPNGDGRLDRAVSDSSCNDSTVRPGKGNLSRCAHAGSGSFAQTPVPDRCFDSPAWDTKREDAGGKGWVDPATRLESGAPTGAAPQARSLSFVKLNPILLSATSLATDDFDGDGVPDLVLAHNSLYFLSGAGDGTFGVPVQVPSSSGSNYVIAGDVNGDGEADLVAVNYAASG